jgi:nucleoside-diphosphate-sugar epimerase
MKILLTGASSFTGYWFSRELTQAGHEVCAIFRRQPEDYIEQPRKSRVQGLNHCRTIFGCTFGDDDFLRLVRQGGPWGAFCHHAADVTDYKSASFDVIGAVRNNTRNLPAVLDALAGADCQQVVLTGSVFENDEGAGSEGLPAFSPYGLSKGLTAQVFRYYTGVRGLPLRKFVIPNPFGPYEERRFTTYLVQTWKVGKAALVSSPAYVRDNIHVTLLAKAYRRFVEAPAESRWMRHNPSGYSETQGAFAQRFAAEMATRLGLACALELRTQTEFPEPRVRINTDVLNPTQLEWDEALAWDEIASYYRERAD